jgi:class 3 adenylate cyclase
MTDIRQWLEDLGLGQYVETFEHNEMDIDLVRDLGDEALEKLGVSAMGHRVKILRAIAALPALATDAREETTLTKKPPAPDAERRQLTVMFCDLVGSTALSERLDPEELRDLMQAYRKACADVIEQYDGHVAQYLGDGVMVYFGWPAAHEDDAGRAVRAGLDIVDAIAGLEAPERLQVRIGVATGLVVVGESGADEGADSRLAVGETPNVAARTQGLAAPGTVAGRGVHFERLRDP